MIFFFILQSEWEIIGERAWRTTNTHEGTLKNFSTTIQGEIYYQLFCYYSTSFRLIASSNFPIVHYLKKIPETFFSSYKRKNVFELK
jgi:hypothetical protein